MAETFPLDPANDVHARALARLREERIGWLGTIGRDGYPHAVPVWFLWHGDEVLTFSQPTAAKVRNLRRDPRAMFHLEAGADGEQLQVLQGDARISERSTGEWMAEVEDAYRAKYTAGLRHLGWNLQRIVDDYSTAILLRPHRMIAW